MRSQMGSAVGLGVGCAVVTGAGAVLNRAKVQPGETVAVIGAAAGVFLGCAAEFGHDDDGDVAIDKARAELDFDPGYRSTF